MASYILVVGLLFVAIYNATASEPSYVNTNIENARLMFGKFELGDSNTDYSVVTDNEITEFRLNGKHITTDELYTVHFFINYLKTEYNEDDPFDETETSEDPAEQPEESEDRVYSEDLPLNHDDELSICGEKESVVSERFGAFLLCSVGNIPGDKLSGEEGVSFVKLTEPGTETKPEFGTILFDYEKIDGALLKFTFNVIAIVVKQEHTVLKNKLAITDRYDAEHAKRVTVIQIAHELRKQKTEEGKENTEEDKEEAEEDKNKTLEVIETFKQTVRKLKDNEVVGTAGWHFYLKK